MGPRRRLRAPDRRERFVFHVFAALAEFIRELIVDGTNEGLAAAWARGRRLGRPPAMKAEQIRQARALLAGAGGGGVLDRTASVGW
ncbi:recombinase family protein [Nocardia nova]|uniref:recombinase family protein n=1 Tax=Nocardia nova TaxID=37330 RepID=UPI003F6987E2